MSPFRDIPVGGLPGLRRHFRQDLLAGFSVSLIALPLSLGIALASGMPPIAGVLTAIVGGLFASRFVGSHVTISGPAAGLIVIVLGAVEALGAGDPVKGYPFALAAIFTAGLIIALMGLLRVGKLGDFFPSAAVHGMLAAIGVIIMVKQSYVALGVAAPQGEMLEQLLHLPTAALSVNPEVLMIALGSILVLLIHPRLKFKWIQLFPAPLWVLFLAIPMAHAFDLFHEHHYHFAGSDFVLGPRYLVNLPNKISDGIVFPDFGMLGTAAFWVAVTSIALVGGLESLLSAKAVDALDPWSRRSNLNRDLMALGGGSALAAFIGGLPMISEIVRSSANINSGGRTQWSNFFHGVFLLIFLLLLKPIIEQIPLSALAAMLIFTGFRLTAPKEFKHMYKIGRKQFAAFLITLVAVICTDLLVGIGVGILAELLMHLGTGANWRQIFRVDADVRANGKQIEISLRGSATFSNYLSLKSLILRNCKEGTVVLDVSGAKLIDHSVMSHLPLLEQQLASMGIRLEVKGLDKLHSVSGHRLSDHSSVKPSKALGKRLSVRQMEVLILAMERKYQYSPLQITHLEIWNGFHFLAGQSVRSVENKLEINECGVEVIVADIHTSSGALLTAAEDLTTYMRIDLRASQIPDFLLENETMVDRLLDGLSVRDIDFAGNKQFSDQYLLHGPDEAAIRSFLNPKRLAFLSSLDKVELEVNSGVLLLRRRPGLVPTSDLQQFAEIGCELVKAFV